MMDQLIIIVFLLVIPFAYFLQRVLDSKIAKIFILDPFCRLMDQTIFYQTSKALRIERRKNPLPRFCEERRMQYVFNEKR